MNPYSVDREWSDASLTLIKQIVGPHLLQVTSFEVDTQQAADLMVLTAHPLKIACRVRRPGYAERYPDEVTFRAFRDSGAKTEWQKIIDEGFGDWFFYGHANQEDRPTELNRWFLLDLEGIRYCLRYHSEEVLGWIESRSNRDGTYFKALCVPAFAAIYPEIVIAASHALPPFRRSRVVS